MIRRAVVLGVFVALAGCQPPPPRVKAVHPNLRPLAVSDITGFPLHAHPRLLCTDEDLERVKQIIATDPVANQWSRRIFEDSVKALTQSPLKYDPEKGIENGRELLKRVTHLAIAYRLSGDRKFADRASENMLAAAEFADWDKPSFLATAETTAAMAIGYDWLGGALSADARDIIRRAIIDKGLARGIDAYESGASWVQAHHNWNLVCNGGLLLGALAVIDEAPQPAKSVINFSRGSIVNGIRNFAPDGGWEEGPTYWNYGTRYLTFYVAAFRSAYGTMLGFDMYPGVSRTGEFRIHTIGPTDKNFNFADASEEPGDSPQMFATAWAFNRPQYAAWERNRSHIDPGVFDLVWFRPADVVNFFRPDEYFRGVECAMFRSNWNDPNATYIAFKGGSNKAHHGHLDLGSFVLDAGGQRWASDLGSERYDLPGFDGNKKWEVYRNSTLGHNTLTFNDSNQVLEASAPLIAFSSTKDRAHAVVDLTAAYTTWAAHVTRGVALLNRRDVLIQDDIDLRKSQRITWAMHTRAKVELSGRTAILRQDGATLTATLLYPPNAEFQITSANPPPPQSPNPDVQKLFVRFKSDRPCHVAVLFTPGDATPNIPRMLPLIRWLDDERLSDRRSR